MLSCSQLFYQLKMARSLDYSTELHGSLLFFSTSSTALRVFMVAVGFLPSVRIVPLSDLCVAVPVAYHTVSKWYRT